MPPNKTQWHKELCKSLAASPKLWMTPWIIHQEEEKKEGDNGKYEEEKKWKAENKTMDCKWNKGSKKNCSLKGLVASVCWK